MPPLSGIDLLLEAYEEAQEVGRSIRDFAVGFADLAAAGFSDNELRKLIHAGHVEFAKPIVHPGLGVALWKTPHVHESCFVLTDKGASHIVANRLQNDRLRQSRSQRETNALLILLEAYNSAKHVNQDLWEFAVPISVLHDAGVSSTILKRFYLDSLVDCASETGTKRAVGRKFSRPFKPEQGRLMFFDNTCFVLREGGVRAAESMQD